MSGDVSGIDQLNGERFVSVQTFRPTGETVSTPVWFATFDGGFVFGTHRDSGKVSRITANPAVRFAAANYRGLERAEYEDGTAQVLAAGEALTAEAALTEKYGWQWTLFSRLIDCYVRVDPS
ncbi:MAG TPA: PPOX class F420-dependent oxidoreductase [Acidimicrobiia bacterium]|nr:PPOX class F420-dependent oxidoreductase [Acidimicrobiia bacterium]